MSDEKNITLLGDLSEVAKALIEKVSDAVGGLCKPFQMKRVAEAEAAVKLIEAKSEIKIKDLQRRAAQRFIEEETKKQLNIEAITQKALPHLEDTAAPQNMSDDWITNFFDKSRIVSDTDMQQLWSRVLAGEANSPGKFSKKTVNLLADLDKSDAEAFTRLCGFGWRIKSFVPLIFKIDDEIYERHGIDFNILVHLESLGFIRFERVGFRQVDLPKNVTVNYYGRPVNIIFHLDEGNELFIGHVRLTRAGEQLASVCGSGPVEGFIDLVYDRWVDKSLVPKRENVQIASKAATPESSQMN